MTDLSGHHALVTGGGSGIGAATARALAAAGARVTIVGRRRAALDEVAESAPGIAVAAADVTCRDAVAAAVATARAAHGPVSILVNNAGIARSAPIAKLGVEEWRATMALNLDAPFHCIQAVLPDLRAAAAGRIVTIASTAGLKGYAYTAAYVASKHGVIGLTRALALELAQTSITVNAVCPGFTDTAIVADAAATISARTGRTAAAARAELARFNPQQRLVRPEEVAAAVVWLCQPESASVTGQAIVVAGGEVM